MPTSDIWKKYYPLSGDLVHPGDEGHAHFADTITNYLAKNLIPTLNPSADEATDIILPSITYCSANNINDGVLYENATILNTTDLSNRTLNGFTEEIGSIGNKNLTQLVSSANGDSISFTIDKQYFGIWTIASGETSITYQIDNGETKTITLSNRTNGELHILAENLEQGQHTVKITHIDDNATAKINYIFTR